MTTAAAPAAVDKDGKPLHTGLVTVSIMLATIMQALDTTIANVALPHMQGSLAATQDQIAWVLTSYIVAAAIMTAPAGILAAKFGRKEVFITSIIGFTITSMLCGIAATLPEMVVFRLLQGVFGAALVPLSQAVLLDINPPDRHGQAMAMWGVGVMLGPILGPTLGGWLTESYNWRWVFFINLPVGIVAMAGMWLFLPASEPDKTRRFDVFGFSLLAIAIGGLQMMLDRGETQDWFSSPEIIAECVVALTALYLFIVHVLTSEKRPFLEPEMFRDRNYVLCLMFMFVVGMLILTTMALLPPYLQNLMGFPVITTGLVLAPRGIGTMAAMMIVGRLIGKVDVRLLIAFGLSMTALSLYEMSLFNLNVGTWLLTKTGLIQGFGMGFIFVPLSTVAYATLHPRFRNDATAVFSLVRNIGSSIGISLMVAMVAQYTQINHAELGARLSPFGMSHVMLQAVPQVYFNSFSTAALALLNGAVTRQAAAISYLNDFRIMTYVVLLALPLLPFLKISRRKPQEEDINAVLE
ncbi:MAG: DHA2 family efflux MFS transporter permease subunit [Alphaproteobacteria bacterium]|nr:DHA2 family efflux MFS transporter permease subunit [Alphaproteobacteria bacterium]